MSDYPMLISNKLHSFRNFMSQNYEKNRIIKPLPPYFCITASPCATLRPAAATRKRQFTELSLNDMPIRLKNIKSFPEYRNTAYICNET